MSNRAIKETLAEVNIHPNKLLRLGRKIKWLFEVYLKPQHDSVVLTRNGKLTFNSKDKTTGRILHVYRNHEFDEMYDAVKFLESKQIFNAKDESIVVDVGGYLGMSSTGFLLNDMFTRAISFEPSPENFRLLEINREINGLTQNMQAYNIALSDEKGSLEFELSSKNYGDNRVRESDSQGHFGEDSREVIKIEANTFDAFLEENSDIEQEKIKLIWIDIQGHEGRFFKGARQFFLKHKNVPVATEFWPYGIERSGVSKEEYLQVAQELFNSFYLLNEYDKMYKIEELEKFYNAHPAGGDGLNLLLLNL